jgi:transposase, IS30 family
MDASLRLTVEGYLKDNQSPEMIEGRIKIHHKKIPTISSRAIRRFIASPYGRRFEIQRKKLLKKRRKKRINPAIKDKRIIDKRPKNINKRRSIGDAEGDFIVSGKLGAGIVLNVTDRKSRAVFVEKIYPVSINNMERAFMKIKKRFPELHSLTVDNDILFIHHKRLEKKLKVKIYFCHVHSPWEKGSNENRNKKLRKYIPKSCDISKIPTYEIKKIENIIQTRIMECLNFKTPKEVLEEFRKQKKETVTVSLY